MKSKTKKQRYVVFQQEIAQTQLAEKALQEYSDYLQYQPYGSTFLEVQRKTFVKESQSLSTWNDQHLTIEPNRTITETTVESKTSKKRINRTSLHFHSKKYEGRNSKICEGMHRSEKRQTKSKLNKKSLVKTRCAISLINPQFVVQKIQQRNKQTSLDKTSSYFLSNQMRESIRQKKALVIRRIKRDLLRVLERNGSEKSTIVEPQPTNDTTRQRQSYRSANICTQIQLKFQQTRAQLSKNKKTFKDDSSLKISRLLTNRNHKSNKGKSWMKKQSSRQEQQNSEIRCSQQFLKLRLLLDRERVQKSKSIEAQKYD